MTVLTIEAARANSLKTDWDNLHIDVPWFVGRRLVAPSIPEVLPYLDWTPLFTGRSFGTRFPAVLDDAIHGAAARALHEDAQGILTRIARDQLLTLRGVYGFWPANADGDDLVVYKDDARATELVRFHMLRQQEQMAEGRPNLSLADFVAPQESFAPDYIGAFAVTTSAGTGESARAFDALRGDGPGIALAVAGLLAEAFAEFLHAQAREDWGYAKRESLSDEEPTGRRYRGIRQAFGHPACPDQSHNAGLLRLLHASEIGITLTDTFAMQPAESVSGIYLSHPDAQYFDVGRIGRDQVEDYATRKGVSVEDVERLLAQQLGY
jgi:5-methyltetrahydrofolate--homocysteine methyltransferase